MIRTKRIYGPPDEGKGFRVLVDRMWPRGVKKENLKIDLWLKEVAPSHELRKWYGHDPQKWLEFKKRYFDELKDEGEGIALLLKKAREGDVVFLYSSKEERYNNAVALKEYIEAAMKRRGHEK